MTETSFPLIVIILCFYVYSLFEIILGVFESTLFDCPATMANQWTKEDQLQLRALIQKAESNGVPVELPPSVASELEDEFEQVSFTSEIPPLTMGAMNDSCKRRPDDLENPARRQMPILTKAQIAVAADRMMEPETPYPTGDRLLTAAMLQPTPSRVTTAFPPGIKSLKQWGQCCIAFGQYAKMDISYDELLTDPSKRSYVKWLKDHHGERSSAEYTDFMNYMEATAVTGESTEAYFPGTRTSRRFKK